jgi:hypothetical protein
MVAIALVSDRQVNLIETAIAALVAADQLIAERLGSKAKNTR